LDTAAVLPQNHIEHSAGENMSSKRKLNIWPLWALVGAIVLFCLLSCSSLKELVGWDPHSDSTETRNPVPDDEIGRFVASVRPHRGNPDSHYETGCSLQERGRHKLAIREFEQVVVLDPSHARAYNRMGISYDFLGDSSRAMENYKKALSMDPDLDYVHNNLGYSYLLQGNPDAAIQAFQRAIALDAEKKRYHNNLAMAYGEKGQFGLAFEEFKQAESEPKAYRNLALLLYRKGHYKDAATNLGKALAASFPKTDKENDAATIEVRSEPDWQERSEQQVFARPIISTERGEQSDTAKAGEVLAKTVPEAGEAMVEQAEDTFQTVVFVPIPKSKNMVISKGKTEQKEPDTPPEVGVEVLNGNGVNRMATRVGGYLSERGFLVLSPRNADHFNHPETKIYYCIGYLQDAYRVAQVIPGYQNMEKAEQSKHANAKIEVLIGKDMIPFDEIFRRHVADLEHHSPLS
jgi:Flp pilus assembly protein TadD